MSAVGPVLRFAVVADVQYGDREDSVKPGPNGLVRRLAYRASLGKLRAAIQALNEEEDLSCIVSVGDFIEGSLSGSVADSLREAAEVMSIFATSRVPVHHVVGNHCRALPRAALGGLLGMDGAAGYRDFTAAPGWRFILLNGAELTLAAVDSTEEDAEAMSRLMRERAMLVEDDGPAAGPNRPPSSSSSPPPSSLYSRLEAPSPGSIPRYYGGISAEQLGWFEGALERAAASGEHVMVFCHYPLALSATRSTHVLVNADAVAAAMERHATATATATATAPARASSTADAAAPSPVTRRRRQRRRPPPPPPPPQQAGAAASPSSCMVRCVFAGHDHLGGSAREVAGAACHVTMSAMLESGPGNAYAVVTARADGSVQVDGVGSVPSYSVPAATMYGYQEVCGNEGAEED